MNNKGFTLIELIMVTIILGILAAVAAPRYMGAVSNAEAASEAATIAALRAAVDNYATQKFMETGRYSYPQNPFDYIEVDGYGGFGWADEDGEWAIDIQEEDNFNITEISHRRRDDNVYSWSYYSNDLTDLDSDDRGANVGLAPENPGSNWTGLEEVLNGERHMSEEGFDVEDGGTGF